MALTERHEPAFVDRDLFLHFVLGCASYARGLDRLLDEHSEPAGGEPVQGRLLDFAVGLVGIRRSFARHLEEALATTEARAPEEARDSEPLDRLGR